MFSGLIGANGTVQDVKRLQDGGLRLRIRCENASDEEVEPKDSIAVNGVCLTAVQVDHNVIDFDVVPETLARSTLGELRPGDVVNVEYSLRLGDRIGGHFVYGHIDGTAEILSRTPEGQGERVRISLPAALSRYVCEKAFISVDGVSVTVAAAGTDWFEIALIPETTKRTTLGQRAPGRRVNLEVDPIARYAVHAAV